MSLAIVSDFIRLSLDTHETSKTILFLSIVEDLLSRVCVVAPLGSTHDLKHLLGLNI